MSRFIYQPFAESMGKQTNVDISLVGQDIGMALVNLAGAGTLYVPSATHTFLSEIPTLSRVATSDHATGPYILNKTFTAGIFTGDPTDFIGVAGDEFEAVALFRSVTNDADSPLICLLDSGTGLPFNPSGGKITISPDPTEGFFNLAAEL